MGVIHFIYITHNNGCIEKPRLKCTDYIRIDKSIGGVLWWKSHWVARYFMINAMANGNWGKPAPKSETVPMASIFAASEDLGTGVILSFLSEKERSRRLSLD